MTVETAGRVALTRTIAASPEQVFRAWTDPEQMMKWACPDPGAELEIASEVRPGGAFRIRMNMPDGVHTAVGEYREVDRPNRVVYTWDWEEEGARMGVDTVITVDFVAVEGGTEVRLVHEGFPAPEHRDGHSAGWGLCFDRFVALFG